MPTANKRSGISLPISIEFGPGIGAGAPFFNAIGTCVCIFANRVTSLGGCSASTDAPGTFA
eukprot:2527712-Prorocentrum_lima.AAC.1